MMTKGCVMIMRGRLFNKDLNGKQIEFSPTFRIVDGQHVYLAYRLAILRNRYLFVALRRRREVGRFESFIYLIPSFRLPK